MNFTPKSLGIQELPRLAFGCIYKKKGAWKLSNGSFQSMKAKNFLDDTAWDIPPEDMHLVIKLWGLASDIKATGQSEKQDGRCREICAELEKRGYKIILHEGPEPDDIFPEIEYVGKPQLH